MNKNHLPIVPKLSTIVLRQARSLFHLKALLSLQPEILPQRVFVRNNGTSRWNE